MPRLAPPALHVLRPRMVRGWHRRASITRCALGIRVPARRPSCSEATPGGSWTSRGTPTESPAGRRKQRRSDPGDVTSAYEIADLLLLDLPPTGAATRTAARNLVDPWAKLAAA